MVPDKLDFDVVPECDFRLRSLLCGCRPHYLEPLACVDLAESASLDMVGGRVGFLLEVVRGPLFVGAKPNFKSMRLVCASNTLHLLDEDRLIIDFSADGAPDLAGLLGKLQ